MKNKVPQHGWCFVCGSENPHSIGIIWWLDEGGAISSEFELSRAQQGPPGHAHGGASAAILDEAMGLVVWATGHPVAAVNIEINYHRPLPLGKPLTLIARVGSMDGQKIFASGEIFLPDESVAVSGHGIYVAAPGLFEDIQLTSE